MNMSGAELEITRVADGWRDRSRASKIIVNGEQCGEFRRGETRTLEVESGLVEVHLKIDWWTASSSSARMVVGEGNREEVLARELRRQKEQGLDFMPA
jgi:hypothetical protein